MATQRNCRHVAATRYLICLRPPVTKCSRAHHRLPTTYILTNRLSRPYRYSGVSINVDDFDLVSRLFITRSPQINCVDNRQLHDTFHSERCHLSWCCKETRQRKPAGAATTARQHRQSLPAENPKRAVARPLPSLRACGGPTLACFAHAFPQPCPHPFLNRHRFELHHRTGCLEHQPTGRSGEIQVVVQADENNT